jgi:hypothetical protein
MKTTTATKKHDAKSFHLISKKQETVRPDEEVAVIVDLQTKAEYYMFVIDSFRIEKRSYVAMIPYEPERLRSKKSELVILRSQVAKNGDQLYLSIRKKKELESAFDAFFRRFEESSKT